MNKQTLTIYILVIAAALCAVTFAAAALKPSINKTVILQIQQFVKK